MGIAQSKITAQGQISIPAKVRRMLGVAPGSVIEWHEQDGKIFVRRASKCTAKDIHKALFVEAPPAKTPAEMDEALRDQMKRKYERR